MADAAELVVRIRGDASDLEATISGVSQQLEELERTQSNTKGVDVYKRQHIYNRKRTALRRV